MDKRSFAIIIIITTLVSYMIIRKYFKIAPRYLAFGAAGIVVGLTIAISIAWPLAAFAGQFGVIVAPYILGMVLMIFIEFFIVEGVNIAKRVRQWIGMVRGEY